MNNQSSIENHLITAMVMLTVALISWVGFTVVESSKTIAALQKDSEFMRADLSEMKVQVANMEELLILRQYATLEYYPPKHNQSKKE